MMREWCNVLTDKLVEKQSYLGPVGIHRDMDPMKFEEHLGKFLRDVAAFSQVKQVVLTSKHFPAAPNTTTLQVEGVLDSWYENTRFHLDQIVEEIHICLFEQFAERHSDPQRARDAYADLLTALGINQSSQWVLATTNYDVIGETAIGLAGFRPDPGDLTSHGGSGETPVQVEGLLSGLPRFTPVLHIHGCVGWYSRNGGTGAVYSAQVTRHQRGFGVPIVMLPDPNKAYDSIPIISSLWTQFIEALQRAQKVFVLGHSLKDEQLASAIRENVPPDRVAITVLASPERPDEFDPSAKEAMEELKHEFQNATLVPIRFGEAPFYAPSVQAWLTRF
jgi:hypothetical protein